MSWKSSHSLYFAQRVKSCLGLRQVGAITRFNSLGKILSKRDHIKSNGAQKTCRRLTQRNRRCKLDTTILLVWTKPLLKRNLLLQRVPHARTWPCHNKSSRAHRNTTEFVTRDSSILPVITKWPNQQRKILKNDHLPQVNSYWKIATGGQVVRGLGRTQCIGIGIQEKN